MYLSLPFPVFAGRIALRLAVAATSLTAITEMRAPLQAQAVPPKAPEFDYLYGNRELFPSALVCFTENSVKAPADRDQLGDTRGVISVRVVAPSDDCPVSVTFDETAIFEESHVAVRLPKAGQTYRIAPFVRYRLEKLATLRQPLANLVLHATIDVAGQKEDRTEKLVVHGIGDAVQRYINRTDSPENAVWNPDAKYMLAAYVNENNPWIDQWITRHALDQTPPYVKSFEGYLQDAGYVRKEVEAIYRTLGDFGFKYTRFPEASAAPVAGNQLIRVQSLRLVGDTLVSRQGNATESALVLASALRKMSVDTIFLISRFPTPRGTVLLGVYLKPGRPLDQLLAIDTRQLGYADFDRAVEAGGTLLKEFREKWFFPSGPEQEDKRIGAERDGYFAIDLGEARRGGILPIPEVRRDLPKPDLIPLGTQKK